MRIVRRSYDAEKRSRLHWRDRTRARLFPAFEMGRLSIPGDETPSGTTLLVIGAAGGGGSILVQLARWLTGLTVIGTASRPETATWVSDLGAHHEPGPSPRMPLRDVFDGYRTGRIRPTSLTQKLVTVAGMLLLLASFIASLKGL